MARGTIARRDTSAGNGGFEAKLWQTADALRNNMDAAEYKHVVLGLIFLKYISDAFEAKHAELVAELEADRTQGADPEDPDEYRAILRNLLHLGGKVEYTRDAITLTLDRPDTP